MQRNLATKIWAKQESGLTAVRLKWDPPVEEEMAHRTQVLVLSHLHLQQAEEIKAQANEIRHLSTLLEKQQAILERVPRAAEQDA